VLRETQVVIETGVGMVLFAGAFLVGGHVHPLRVLMTNPRSLISFGTGISTAYVFMDVMPELSDARRAFTESTSLPTPFQGMAVYFMALLGFLVFYGLDRLPELMLSAEAQGQTGPAFKLKIGGFAAYIWVMAYLLVNNLKPGSLTNTLIYALAITCHFVTLDHGLREEHGAAYDKIGRYWLSGMAVLGWVVGLFLPLPREVLVMLMAFVLGAVIVNNSIMDLEKGGRFLPFMCGGILYALILAPFG
jgi:hypothetical protein